MRDTLIEQANINDAKEILELQKLAYQSEAVLYNNHSLPPLMQTLESIEAEFSDHLFLKAMLETQIIGSVRAKYSVSTCFIGRLIVHPEYQGQGIGSTLIKEIERYAPTAQRFELFTGHKSKRNIKLYEQLGYKLFKTQEVNKGLSLMFMEKTRGDSFGAS